MKDSNTNNTGIGFAGALQIAFIVLKLTNFINWSWVWVLAPTWIEAILVVVAIIVLVTVKQDRR